TTRLSCGPGASSKGWRLRTPETTSRVSCMGGAPRTSTGADPPSPNDFARPKPGEAVVPRGTRVRPSEAQRHHHVPAAFARRLTDQGGRIRVAQLQDHLFVAQGREGVEQVVDVEADGQPVDAGLGLDFFL